MALRSKSLFLYGFEVTSLNSSLDFRSVSAGPILQATLRLGYYTLTSLMTEIARAMSAADPINQYSVTADRTFNGGTENRITITALTSGYLDLLFLSGPRTASTVANLIGFPIEDFTGALFYVSEVTSGVSLIPEYIGYNYLPPELMRKNFGSVNVSASGAKESITFSIQKFFQAEFRYEPESKAITEWTDLMTWLIQQRSIEFTPQVSTPTTFYVCTLETSSDDGKGLGYSMKEMLPQFPFNYTTGMMKFRVNPE